MNSKAEKLHLENFTAYRVCISEHVCPGWLQLLQEITLNTLAWVFSWSRQRDRDHGEDFPLCQTASHSAGGLESERHRYLGCLLTRSRLRLAVISKLGAEVLQQPEQRWQGFISTLGIKTENETFLTKLQKKTKHAIIDNFSLCHAAK